MTYPASTRGYNIMEIMVAIAILAIIAAIAVPTYLSHVRSAIYSELIAATAPYAIGVNLCYKETHDLKQCNGGEHNVPPNINNPIKNTVIKSITVKAGKIIATPKPTRGIRDNDTYVLTPHIDDDKDDLSWKIGGGGVKNGYI